MKYILLFIALFFLVKENDAQIYLNDPNWSQVKHDDFNSLNTTDWFGDYCGGPVNNGDEYNSTSNLLFNHTTGYLSIKCEKLTSPINYPSGSNSYYPYQSGAIWSKFNFKYGYWEIRARYPAGHKGYWPAFYLYGAGPNSCITPGIDGYINEIDIMENGGQDSQSTDKMGINYWWRYLYPSCIADNYAGTLLMSSTQTVPGNITTDHKYGMFWEPGKMTWYYDDVAIKTVTDPTYTPDHAIATVINFAIDRYYQPNPSTVFPAYFEIDYLNIYQLNSSGGIPKDCSIVENICSFNAVTYSYQVKKSISIGGSGCTSGINTTDNVSLWATDYVLLNEGTTITSGGSGSFTANTTNCPN